MSKKYPGGIITKSPATPTGPYQTGTAPGVWTMDQASYWIKQNLWPTAGLIPNWVMTLSSSTFSSIAIDNSGNICVGGQTSSGGAGALDWLIAKTDPVGNIQWQRTFGGSSNEELKGLALDSSGNIYCCGNSRSTGGGIDYLMAKFDTSGLTTWQKTLNYGGYDYCATSVAVNSSGTACYVGFGEVAVYYDLTLFQLNGSSGSLVRQNVLDNGSFDAALGTAVDSSNNIYMCGWLRAGTDQLLLTKFNSSNSILWQQSAGNGYYGNALNAVTLDSSGNVIACGNVSNGVHQDIYIVKFNSSGTFLWDKRITSSGSNDDYGYSVAVDSSDNIYVVGTAGGVNDAFIVKFNSAGTVQWQRTLGGSGTDTGYGITIANTGHMYIAGSFNGSGLIAKLPTDGTGTGSFTVGGYAFTYAASSLTISTPSYSYGSPGYSVSGGSYTLGTPSLTNSASSLTRAITNV